MLARVETSPSFLRGGAQALGPDLTEDEIAGRVGVSSEWTFVGARQYVQGGVLEGVITPGFKDEGEVEEHGVIIREKRG